MNIITKRLILILCLFAGFTAQAQKSGNVTGKVLDKSNNSPVDYASVVVRKLSDSSTVKSVVTAPTGVFEIKDLAPGAYFLQAGFLGYNTAIKNFTIAADRSNVNIGNILIESAVNLEGVEFVGQAPPVRVKKDTIEFAASQFKVKENAVVEDVLKKLPGVEVDKSGSITAQGETITKVRVDGKDFMGNDPLLATRNLPADMIDKIQIIDDLSDQSKFSGIDDGNREKIINITTRQEKKFGYFGNSTIAGGTDDRYEASINVNKFKNDQQFSVIGQFNNINKQSFGAGGGGGMGGGRGGMGGGFGGGGASGVTTTNALGFNFADTYADETKINGSYFFNKTSTLNTSSSFTQNLFGNNTTTVKNDAYSLSERLNHRLNFTIDTKIDSTTSIRIQPNLSYTQSDGLSTNSYDRNVLTTQTVGFQSYDSHSTAPSFSNSILVRKKFQRRGRTLSLNVNTNINSSDANNYNNIQDVITTGTGTITNLTNQLNDNNGKNFSNTARLVFTEPLSKTLNLELNYQNSFSKDNNDRLVYNFDPIIQEFTVLDPTYTNMFENRTLTNSLGFSINKVEKKYNWNVGLAVQNTDRENLNLSKGTVFNQNFYNLTPTAQYRYTFSQNKRFELNYRGSTQQPSINQIQPIPDNTNTQSVVLGNPMLKPSFGNNIRMSYRNFNFASFKSFFSYLNFTQTFNAFASDQRLVTNPTDPNYGKIATTFVNVKGNISANGGVNLGQPLLENNKISMSIGFNGNYNKETNFTNGLENINNRFGGEGTLKIVSNMDKLDLNAGVRLRYDNSKFSAQPNSNTDYYTLVPNIDISYMFPGNIRFQTDVNYNKVTGRGNGFDTEYTLVNAFISRQFFKNRGTFKLSAYDLFNQNTGITRTASANSIQDSNFNVLKRYFLFGFTYTLNRVGGQNVGGAQGNQQRGSGMMGGGMMRM